MRELDIDLRERNEAQRTNDDRKKNQIEIHTRFPYPADRAFAPYWATDPESNLRRRVER